jgi:hypothetical protein
MPQDIKPQPPQNEAEGYQFGDREAQAAFSEKRQDFLKRLPNIWAAENAVISGAHKKNDWDTADKMIYFLVRQAFEDFNEILLLCANGFSTGGLKILRGMFERTVTACYLQKHPSEAETYFKYRHMREHKEAQLLEKHFPGRLSKERLDEIKAQYEEVRGDFQIPVCSVCKIPECDKCKKTRDNHSWTKMDIVAMAHDAEAFDPIVYDGYLYPIRETHSTESAIAARVMPIGEENYGYDEGPKPKMDRRTLMTAHYLIFRAINALDDQFRAGVDEKIQKVWKDWQEIWKNQEE